MVCSSDRSIVSKDDAGGGHRLAPAFGSRRPMNGLQRIQSHRNSFLDSSLVRTQISLLSRGWHFKFIGILNHDVAHGTHHLAMHLHHHFAIGAAGGTHHRATAHHPHHAAAHHAVIFHPTWLHLAHLGRVTIMHHAWFSFHARGCDIAAGSRCYSCTAYA